MKIVALMEASVVKRHPPFAERSKKRGEVKEIKKGSQV